MMDDEKREQPAKKREPRSDGLALIEEASDGTLTLVKPDGSVIEKVRPALAWPLRYIIFAIGGPTWLVIASLALHGFCYVFFFVAAFIYVDKVAPPDIRA